MPRLRPTLSAAALTLTALLTAGCERAIFGFANRGLPPPESTVAFAPELGLSLDVYRPQGGSTGTVPTVLFFYGGGWQRGEREQYRFVGRRLAQQGVLAIVADYRTFPHAGFPAFVDDAARAVAWARQHAADYRGDPRRLYIAGHSAGAQIAALLGTDPRYLSRHGLQPRDLAGVIGLSGPYDFVINGQYTKVFGPPAQWPQAQAINFVDGNEPPFLLIHGDRDRVVESRDSVEMDAKLRAAGIDARLLILPGGGHSAPLAGLYDPQRSPAVLPAIVAFVDGRREPVAAAP
ncbi:alpha/beta hydrolase [Lysobacter koreensis]|uniref:Alpha/beta hydrolase n=1 Tax=Lysobacter koreensis TaxID=266122 RepID=A0ABW2YTY4_9GAMM